MNLQNVDLRSFATAILKTYSLNNLKINSNEAIAEIMLELEGDLKELNSSEVKEARLQNFKVGEAKDYCERIFQMEDGRRLLYGIRHEGGNPAMPFINCIPDFSISSKLEAMELASLLIPSLKVFKPTSICFWTNEEIGADRLGSLYLVTNKEGVNKLDTSSIKSVISLEAVKDESYYDWYLSQYREFHVDRPDLQWTVNVNSKSTMDESLRDRLLFYAKIEEERIGLIAAVNKSLLGRSGKYFNDIVVCRKWKGKGLAKEIQKRFILEVCKDSDIVWGTINCLNIPSLKTAISNGRETIRYESFFEIDSKCSEHAKVNSILPGL